jgi:hypothetical protein
MYCVYLVLASGLYVKETALGGCEYLGKEYIGKTQQSIGFISLKGMDIRKH